MQARQPEVLWPCQPCAYLHGAPRASAPGRLLPEASDCQSWCLRRAGRKSQGRGTPWSPCFAGLPKTGRGSWPTQVGFSFLPDFPSELLTPILFSPPLRQQEARAPGQVLLSPGPLLWDGPDLWQNTLGTVEVSLLPLVASLPVWGGVAADTGGPV